MNQHDTSKEDLHIDDGEGLPPPRQTNLWATLAWRSLLVAFSGAAFALWLRFGSSHRGLLAPGGFQVFAGWLAGIVLAVIASIVGMSDAIVGLLGAREHAVSVRHLQIALMLHLLLLAVLLGLHLF